MLHSLERHARRLGHRGVVLDTNSTLVEAISMYGRAGYRDIERYNDNPYALCWFENCWTDLPTPARQVPATGTTQNSLPSGSDRTS